ncbi:hypothetical protein [Algoriphagus boritolerans]|uniref:hypothetical protein n=1 Tax=Algoriphagus boritolerans TaxID=308111 RepID=UPI000A5C8F65
MQKTTPTQLFGLLIFVFGLLLIPDLSFAQGAYLPYDRDYYHKVDRYEILQGRNNPFFNSGYKPYRRDILAKFLDSLAKNPEVIRSKADRFNLDYMSQDNWEFSEQETPESKKNHFLNPSTEDRETSRIMRVRSSEST